jgi:hypothetical protein
VVPCPRDEGKLPASSTHLGGVEDVRACAAPHTLKYTAIALDRAVQRGYRTMLSIEPEKDA